MAPAKAPASPAGWEPVEEPKGWEEVPAQAAPAIDPNYNYAQMGPDTTGPATRYLRDLEADVKSGGNRTVIGRTLGKIQGRGDQGYTGIEAGVSPGAAEFMGSPVMGPIHAAQGEAEIPKHPISGLMKMLGGDMETVTIPSMVMGDPGPSVIPHAIEAIPSKKFAVDLFKDVSEHAGNVPVNLTRSGDELLKMGEGGGKLPTPIKALIERYTKPIKGATKSSKEGARPLTYDEARKFYENITSLSANDKMGMTPGQTRQLGIIREALKHDIGEAANGAGQAAKYYAAMKNYAQASKLLQAADNIKKWGIRAAGVSGASAIGAGAYEYLKGK